MQVAKSGPIDSKKAILYSSHWGQLTKTGQVPNEGDLVRINVFVIDPTKNNGKTKVATASNVLEAVEEPVGAYVEVNAKVCESLLPPHNGRVFLHYRSREVEGSDKPSLISLRIESDNEFPNLHGELVFAEVCHNQRPTKCYTFYPLTMQSAQEKRSSLERVGLKDSGNLYWNLPVAGLYEEALKRNEAVLSKYGSIIVNTAPYTGRSPKDRFIVKEPSCTDKVWWGKINQPIDEEKFNALKERVCEYLGGKDLFIKDCYAGADERFRLPIRVISEKAIASLFSGTMFIQEGDPAKLENFTPEFTIIHAPNFKADPKRDGTPSEAFIFLNFAQKIILIGGTSYAGEIKKSIFSVMNYLMPQKGIMSMHASANYGADENDVAVFFGLSGTGKTTLSADSERTLIGDDEHGWSDDGVFNYEGGCYAKLIKLREEAEPDIYRTTRMFGSMLENVVFDPNTHEVNLDDDSITENTRGSYPVSAIPNMTLKGTGGHPKNIIMLTCDAFGVLPPVSKLTHEQAMYHFISGYTAKVAGTERGIKEPQATFSPCFGGPFMALHPTVYAKLLGEKIKKHNVDVYLINTGWSGGSYGVGSRIKIPHTRAMVKAALNGSLKNVQTKKDPIFGVLIPVSCPGVPQEILEPRNTWADKDAYDKKAKELLGMFEKNFKEYAEVKIEV